MEEISHSHGTNIFEINYRGTEQQLLKTIADRCSVLETQASPIGINKAKIHIAADSDVRGVIAAVNESVELRSFSEVIPTMNDIFIRAVEHNV